jgi:hypothetical protein
MRAQDRMAVCELQEAETATLKALFAHDSRVDVRAGDGYALLRSLLPPKFNGSKIGRGLVLIDPPYEAQDAEYQASWPPWPRPWHAGRRPPARSGSRSSSAAPSCISCARPPPCR